MGQMALDKVLSRELGMRRFFVYPPEPPPQMLMADPTDSIYLGRTKLMKVPVYWDFKRLANPHICVLGITGSGKSYLVKTFLTRAALVWKANALILDWAGEYPDWVKQTGGKVISLGKGDSINLLDLAGMRPSDRIKQVMTSLELLTDLGKFDYQKQYTEKALEQAYLGKGLSLTERPKPKAKVPTLHDVVGILEKQLKKEPAGFKSDELEQTIFRLGRYTMPGSDWFARPSTLALESLTSSGLVCLDLHGLPSEEMRSIAGLTVLQFIKEKMRDEGWSPNKGVKLFVVADEAWKIAQDERSDLITIVREGRKYQFSLLVASQNPTDIHPAIISNVGTMFVLRLQLREYKDYVRRTLGYSAFIESQIDAFGVGQAALHMAFSKAGTTNTFILERIEGEEPLHTYVVEVEDMELMIDTDVLRRKLAKMGLAEKQAQTVLGLFEAGGRRASVLQLVGELEKYGFARANIVMFLRDLGVRELDLTKIFAAIEKKKLGPDAQRLRKLVLEKSERAAAEESAGTKQEAAVPQKKRRAAGRKRPKTGKRGGPRKARAKPGRTAHRAAKPPARARKKGRRV